MRPDERDHDEPSAPQHGASAIGDRGARRRPGRDGHRRRRRGRRRRRTDRPGRWHGDRRHRRRSGQPRPAHVGPLATNDVNVFAYETLVYLAPDGEIRAGLAESWEETPTSVTYTLKEGITCGDGSELTATTVAENFSFVADPANQSPLLGVHVPPGIRPRPTTRRAPSR